jgi:hypothetical protein
LQKNLIKITFLIHFDKRKWFWIDLDEFKEFDFEVIVFHVIKKFSKKTWSIKNNIQFIIVSSPQLVTRNVVTVNYVDAWVRWWMIFIECYLKILYRYSSSIFTC